VSIRTVQECDSSGLELWWLTATWPGDHEIAPYTGSLRQVPTYVTTAYFLASCYAHMERLDDARAILDHLRSIGSPLMPPPELGLRDPTQREFWVSGLRRAAG